MTELDVLIWIHGNMTNPAMDAVSVAANCALRFNILWMALGVFLMFFKRTRTFGALLFASEIISTLLLNLPVKYMFVRPRPFTEYQVALLIDAPISPSFPSDHTQGAFAFAAALFVHSRRWGIAAGLFGLFIAFTRMYLFVHYPTDVIGGALFGILSVILAYLLIESVRRKRTET